MVPMKFTFIFLAVLQGIAVTLAEDNTTSSTEAASTDPSTPDTTDPSTPDTTDATSSAPASPCEDDPHVNCAKLKPQCSDHRYDDLMNQ
ncbi:ShKT domain-containing protein [Trichostrongylus colubriformis]|uniref:ShKT domain-containing protein n=1 Tax=Trichostrongylus colubriformis TaxID=6319 RepID=A0AAN8IUK3_TRICO